MLPTHLQDIDGPFLDQLVNKLAAGLPTDDSSVGLAVWITGLSGAGKTTVASLLESRFHAASYPCVLLDGDAVRALLRREWGLETGHEWEQRLALAGLYAKLCQALVARGYDVVCATVSMFHEVRDWNRAHIPNYLEIYLRVPLDELRRRDPKGHYARSVEGGGGMVGIGMLAEEPRTPDLVIDHAPNLTPDDSAQTIWRMIHSRKVALADSKEIT